MFMGTLGFPGGADGKASVCDAGDPVPSLGWEDPLEKEMATHSSTLVWKIPLTEEPGRLQSVGSQRVRHDWATSLLLFRESWLMLMFDWFKLCSGLTLILAHCFSGSLQMASDIAHPPGKIWTKSQILLLMVHELASYWLLLRRNSSDTMKGQLVYLLCPRAGTYSS